MVNLEQLGESVEEYFQEALRSIKDVEESCRRHVNNLLEKAEQDVEEYYSTGILPAWSEIKAASAKENDSGLANESQSAPQTARRTRLTAMKSQQSTFNNNCTVKIERISENSVISSISLNNGLHKIKREADEMPPPVRLPLKRTRRQKALSVLDPKGLQIKQEIIDEQTRNRDSDVILTTNEINVVVLDSDEEELATKPKKRAGRTKKQQITSSSTISQASGSESDSNPKEKYPKTVLNTTVVIDKPQLLDKILTNNTTQANQTFIIDNQVPANEENIIETSVKETRATKQKPVFSPYSESPVKNRVAAFEKLGIGQMESVARSTRANKKKMIENLTSGDGNNDVYKKKTAIPKLRTTPINEARIIPVFRSEVKASEGRDVDLKQKQKEVALLKKEAIITTQMEERRRKNEERQLKVQQQRDMLAKEKQLLLVAAENAKQNKQKQMESLKKKALTQKKQQKQPTLGLDKNGIPLLPTPDCYDSDDEENQKRRIPKPDWYNNASILMLQQCLPYAKDHGYGRHFFSCTPQFPDLRKIIPGSKPVHRNSSVIWDTTMMSLIEEN